MDNLVQQLADFLADYDVDVYEDVNLGGDKYRLDCVIVEDHVGSLKARLRIQKALEAFNTFPDSPRGVTVSQVAPIIMNERSDDEYDFSVVIEFKKTDERKKQEEHFVPFDERPFTEERVEDSLDVKVKRDYTVGEAGGQDVTVGSDGARAHVWAANGPAIHAERKGQVLVAAANQHGKPQKPRRR